MIGPYAFERRIPEALFVLGSAWGGAPVGALLGYATHLVWGGALGVAAADPVALATAGAVTGFCGFGFLAVQMLIRRGAD